MVYPPPAVKKADFPILQVALDHIDPEEALRLAGQAVRGGADWIEAGTPLIKSAGMSVIGEARKEAPNIPLVAEMKPLDVGRTELELAFEAGADMAIITGLAPLTTISECVQAARLFRRKLILDTRGMEDLLGREKALGLLKHIQQNYHAYLTEPLPDSRVITSLEIKQKGIRVVKKLKELFPDRSRIGRNSEGRSCGQRDKPSSHGRPDRHSRSPW
jgi:3-keto-L-gulonate-6-phosphate decarboxylase